MAATVLLHYRWFSQVSNSTFSQRPQSYLLLAGKSVPYVFAYACTYACTLKRTNEFISLHKYSPLSSSARKLCNMYSIFTGRLHLNICGLAMCSAALLSIFARNWCVQHDYLIFKFLRLIFKTISCSCEGRWSKGRSLPSWASTPTQNITSGSKMPFVFCVIQALPNYEMSIISESEAKGSFWAVWSRCLPSSSFTKGWCYCRHKNQRQLINSCLPSFLS